ncbi:MAG: DoxX family protein [Pseudomonadota bacterium]
MSILNDRARLLTLGTWAAMAFVSLIMLAGAFAKFTSNPQVVEGFQKLGTPGWFMLFIGASELAGAFGIWLRQTSMLAALGIGIIMVGAIYFHIVFSPLTSAIPAILVLAVCGYIVWRRGTGVIG